MKRKIARLFKKLLVHSKQDKLVASLFERTGLSAFGKLIPDWSYYDSSAILKVKRRGVIFKLKPSDFSQWQILSNNNFSHVNAAIRVLGNDCRGLILDIGANCGHFSLTMANHIFKEKWKSKVVSFEPNPEIFNFLKNNLFLNADLVDIVHLNNVGVGSTPGEMELQVPIRNSGAGSLARNYESEPHNKYKIKIITIDDLLQGDEEPVKFIKIDVENFEFQVLKGASKIIEKFRPSIFLEINEGDTEGILHIADFLRKLGYLLYVQHGENYVLFDEKSKVKLMDILAVYKIAL